MRTKVRTYIKVKVYVEDGAMKTFGDLIVGEDDVGFVDYKGFLATLSNRQKDVLELSERGFDTDDIADMSEVISEVTQALIDTSRMYKWGSPEAFTDRYVSFNDFNYVVGLIKK